MESVWVTARLKKGVTIAEAQADIDPIIRDLAARSPNQYPAQWRVDLMSFKETFPSGISTILWVMFAAVGLLLLIAVQTYRICCWRALPRERRRLRCVRRSERADTTVPAAPHREPGARIERRRARRVALMGGTEGDLAIHPAGRHSRRIGDCAEHAGADIQLHDLPGDYADCRIRSGAACCRAVNSR